MPARLSDIARACAALGIEVEKPKTGSHWKARLGGTVFPIPAGNAGKTEIPDLYIRKLCRCFGIDEKTLRSLL